MANYTAVELSILADVTSKLAATDITGMPAPQSVISLPDDFPSDTSIGIDVCTQTGVVLYYPQKDGATESVCLPSQVWPLERPVKLSQKVIRTASGKVAVYNLDAQDKYIKLKLKNVPAEKRQRLRIFLLNIVKGALNTFQIEDEGGNLYTVRWVDSEINDRMEFWLKYGVELTFRVEE